MSVTELSHSRPDVFIAPTHNLEETSDSALAFVAAADQSHGPYDTPEQRLDRIIVAAELGAAMVPGAPVLHEIGKISVHAGILTETPRVIEINNAQVFEYTLRLADGTEQTHYMPFRDLIYGTRYGATAAISSIAAGAEDVSSMVAERYYCQRAAEAQPGGIPWNDMSPITELYMYGALGDANIYLSDILAPDQVGEMRARLQANAADRRHAHLRPNYEAALANMERPKPTWRDKLRKIMGNLATVQ